MRLLWRLTICLVLGAIGVCALQEAQKPATNYDEAKVGTYALPDPLVFANGKPVHTAHDWQLRRAEILALFEENVFGRQPRPRRPRFKVFESSDSALGGKAVRRQVTVYFGPSDDVPKEDLLLYLPRTATKPVPVFLALNFSGNHAVINDPAVRLATIWRRVPNPHREASSPSAHHQETAKEETRGRDKSFPVEQILDRGYGFATIYYQDIEPDFQDGVEYSVRRLFPSVTGDDAWGAIGAWAYGLSRAMDYLETERGVDAKRIAIMGHSRLGKTALWEGAIEPRTAMVIASCPGEGGASLARRNYGETLRDTTRYWFAANLARYADDPNKLPVDMHELIALSAPRPVYITGAEDDRWADPKGEFLAEVAAGPVFRLLGQRDLGTSEWPPLNQPIMATLAYHYREGKHEVTPFDWEQFLKFADMHFHR